VNSVVIAVTSWF